MPWKATTHAERMKAARTPTPDDRPSAADRGYGHNWTKIRALQLKREPLCRECTKAGFVVVAVLVDHIVPLSQGGTNHPSNLQSLCQSHHNKKIAAERGSDGKRNRFDNVPGDRNPGPDMLLARNTKDK